MKTGFKNIVQSIFSFFFIIVIIGSGHLLMITVEHFDVKFSAREYAHPGREAVWHGDTSQQTELQKMIDKSTAKGNERNRVIFQNALQSLENGNGIKFNMLPVSGFFIVCTIVAILVSLFLLVCSRFFKHNAVQTLMGILAGFFAWIVVELGLTMASRQLGVAKRFDIVNDVLIGARGEYVLLKYSWVFLVPVLLYLLFQESVRCNMFLFLRRKLRLMRGPVAAGRIDNYAPRAAFFFASSVWTFYVLLLLAFDGSIFGAESWFTYLIFFVCFSSTGYLFYRLVKQRSFGANLRYAVGTALVFWTDIEILEKWGTLEGPWLTYRPVTVFVFIAALLLGGFLVIRETRTSGTAVPAMSKPVENRYERRESADNTGM
jgi:hypothetical protein